MGGSSGDQGLAEGVPRQVSTMPSDPMLPAGSTSSTWNDVAVNVMP